jgi:hypothetical protein
MEILTGNSPPDTRGWRASPEYLLLGPEDKYLIGISSLETRTQKVSPESFLLRPENGQPVLYQPDSAHSLRPRMVNTSCR